MLNCKFVHAPPIAEIPEGLLYVPQDNYYLMNLNMPAAVKYLYTDGATSCIILVLAGQDQQHNPLVAVAHPSSPARLLQFFRLAAKHFYGAAAVFAQGANPPDAEGSKNNISALLRWMQAHFQTQVPRSVPGIGWHLTQVTLALGAGHPQEDNRGCAGIDLATLTVSNQNYLLTEEQRDPTGGAQMLFSIFGLTVKSPMPLHNAREAFRPDELDRLVKEARIDNWTDILDMTEAQVLARYSSTPACEAPWFYAALRKSALYVKNYRHKRT
jgi:hypothetical protein